MKFCLSLVAPFLLLLIGASLSANAQCLNNDDRACADTIPHTLNWCSPYNGYCNDFSTPDGPPGSCHYNGPDNNIWFCFQATSNEVKIDMTSDLPEILGGMLKPYLLLWDTNEVEIGCAVFTSNNCTVTIEKDDLVVGDWYWISCDQFQSSGGPGTFTLCMTTENSYDMFSAAHEITDLNNWCSALQEFDTEGASPDQWTGSCTASGNGPSFNRWFKFTAPATGLVQIDLKTGNDEGDMRYPYLMLFDTAGTALNCQAWTSVYSDLQIINETLTPGETYYISVDNLANAANNPTNVGTFSLCVSQFINSSVAYTICTGDSAWAGGAWQTATGTYADTLSTTSGNDSLAVTFLTVDPGDVTQNNFTLCTGDSLLWAGAWRHAAGSYTDSLSNHNGCDSMSVANLAFTNEVLGTDNQSICDGDSILLGGQWRFTAGNYVDTLVAVAGCDSIRTTALNIWNAPIDTIQVQICQGHWHFAQGQWQAQSGIYVDFLTTDNGCDSLLYTDLTVAPLPTVSVTPAVTDLCVGGSVTLSATGGGGGAVPYGWSPNVNLDATSGFSVTANPTDTITYFASVVDSNDCVNFGQATVNVFQLESVSITASATTINAGETVTLTASGAAGVVDEYGWSPNIGLSSTTGATVSATPTDTVTYFASATDENGCQVFASITINAATGIGERTIGIPADAWISQSRKELVINLGEGGSGNYQLVVYNAVGQQLHTSQLRKGQAAQTLQLPMHQNTTGVYLVSIANNHGQLTKKLVMR